VAGAYRTVRRELKAYGGDLAKKKEIVALSKIDAIDEDTLALRLAELQKAARKKPLALSAVSGLGVKDALFALTREIKRAKSEEAEAAEAARTPWRP
jgi:GTP-binding protein